MRSTALHCASEGSRERRIGCAQQSRFSQHLTPLPSALCVCSAALPPQGPQCELVSGARSALLDVLELANARTWEPRIIAELSVRHDTHANARAMRAP